MIIKGNNYNFGRVIYLTIAKTTIDAQNALNTTSDSDVVVIAFDPKKDQQLNTRIDFWVKHTGESMSSNANAAYSLANIDVYNVGPALEQFMNAYNDANNKGMWLSNTIRRYACSLQVGYTDGTKTTIFTGFISSWYVERMQSGTTVDNVWHLYAQYPTTDTKFITEDTKAVSGEDYLETAKQELPETFVSAEEYLRGAIMAYPRETYAYVALPDGQNAESFSIIDQLMKKPEQTYLTALPATREITPANFDKFFTIKYQHYRTGEEYPLLKQEWQKREAMTAWDMDYSILSNVVSSIAAKKNCHATIQMDENTGMQTIYIYPAGKPQYRPNVKADFVIENFQNLRRQPGVAGNQLQLDLIMEPSIKPGDLIELTITEDFASDYKNKLSFEPNFGGVMPNAYQAFGGANFIGMHNFGARSEQKQAMAQHGNVFGNKYVAVFVIHQGSSHSAEWATQVDCYGVILADGSVKQ